LYLNKKILQNERAIKSDQRERERERERKRDGKISKVRNFQNINIKY